LGRAGSNFWGLVALLGLIKIFYVIITRSLDGAFGKIDVNGDARGEQQGGEEDRN